VSPEPSVATSEPLGLGLILLGLLAVAFFGFIGLCAFAPVWSAAPLAPGRSVNAAFVLGLGVIGLGVVLTGLYVVVANAAEARAIRARP
jgi:uncharacterized membrane protein (DUF485 family)